ncbi:hypothetical protein SPRG_05219 [Saprolegnia parasitica CBS 223.65]|uniref:BSD domain-containing protein n=1 Tax=Saprolegnia parasitica (strain CBS 223.65) TaxID=695850 RepID=A0A067CH01_SAPPC|nr:hypothetical protein SPRG_05219 [Saprolegnia parasitica CBS 223.65]KDO30029.1 hypothetical protein SPRG_05219 [Saprolegnia parasitica CBS 223.65]|eukprot:XP_012199211.1 hypothetical protein SPRG_05219 [Saprolegnia parasitica CBS 223.65]
MASYSFYSLVSAVKDKSAKAISTLSSDLQEFSTTVQGDVAEVAKHVKKKVEETMESKPAAEATDEAAPADSSKARELQASVTASLFAFGATLESVGSKLLTSADEFIGGFAGDEANDTHDEPLDEAASARRFRLSAMQNADETYVEPPANMDAYTKWRQAISDDDWAALCAEVIEHYPTIDTKRQELVPELVSEDAFWGHYLYKASRLAAQEQRSAQLLQKVAGASADEEEIGWDVDSPLASPTAKTEPAATAAAELAPETKTTPVTSHHSDEWIDVDETKKAPEAAIVLADEEVLDWGDDNEPAPAAKSASDDWGQWE